MSRARRFLLNSAVAAALTASLAAQNALAPTGTLRATFLGDNPVLGRVDGRTGVVTGTVADLVRELARRLGVPYALLPAAGARDIIGRLQSGTADLGFLAYNAGRASEVDFSMPWLLMPNTYIVRADSPLKKVADADRAGIRITAVRNDTQDVYLSSHLRNTHVDTVPTTPEHAEIRDLVINGKTDAFAANRQRLLEVAGRFPGLRVLDDDYFIAGQSIAIAKGDGARLETLNRVLAEVLATDLVKVSIERAGLRGVSAAQPGAH